LFTCKNAKGNPKRIIGTYEPNTLDSFEKADEFEKQINDICKKYGLTYLNRESNGRYNKAAGTTIDLDNKSIEAIVELIEPYYKIGVKDLIVFALSGFLYKLGVDKDSTIQLIDLLTRNDRKAVAVTEGTYNKNRDEVVGYRWLLEILSQSTSDKYTAQRVIDSISEIIGSPKCGYNYYSNIPELQGSVFYVIASNPTRFIIADNHRKHLIEATLHKSTDTKHETGTITYTLIQNKTFLVCIPTKIIRHRNPLTYLDLPARYTITFIDAAGEQNTFNHKTLAEIIGALRDLSYVFLDGAEGALGVIMQAYKGNKLIQDNEDMVYTGFFSIGTGSNKKIIASNIEIKEPSIVDLEDSLKFIEQLAGYYKGRLDLLATLIIWGSIAPVIFMLKENNYFLKWLHFYGFPNTTKSNSGKIILALDRHHNDYKYLLSIGRIDSIARLGDILSNSTFPKLVDEAWVVKKKNG
jgi:hypothetical protein